MIRPQKPAVSTSTPESSSPAPQALPLEQCLAKTWPSLNDTFRAGRTVESHCRIVEAVALRLLDGMLPLQRSLFPERAERLPLVHDVGKICPTFQEKIYRATGCPANSLAQLHNANPKEERDWGGHAAVSMATLADCRAARYVAEIAGQHHGATTTCKPADYSGFGGSVWQERRREQLARLLGQAPETPGVWPDVRTPEQARLLAGLTIVADWIGSGSRFDDPAVPWEPLVDEAVNAAGFLPVAVHPDLSFQDVFSFAPLAVQRRFYEQVTAPGVYVLEAPMGMGKTEAALYAAYGMLQKGLSSGVYFALPTQLTSNRIHTRLNAFLDTILDGRHHAQLLHGKAWLSRFQQQEMGEEAAPEGAWFHQRKRGILAPFAAGTVDQALMAVMHVRHGAVRAYGLAGKTVILDEVHSYDAYTGVILDALVALLRHYGCTVLILSATLTAGRRAVFTGKAPAQAAYPLVSVSREYGALEELPCEAQTDSVVTLGHPADDTAALEEALLRAEQGQQVLWIENTVAEAQARYHVLSARGCGLGLDVGLLHSRFTPADRRVNEDRWTTLYGKSAPDRAAQGRILVGTQVLEQSLDIDADFLVTRFCPTDMLLQRLGRLWRHASTGRPPMAHREAWLLHPSLSDVVTHPETAWDVTGNVYMPYVLYRSLELWAQRTTVALPQDIRPLLEATYAERLEQDAGILRTLHKLEQERNTLQNLALRGVSTNAKTLTEEQVSTRAGQRPEADVLLLRAHNPHTGRVVLADGTELSLTGKSTQTWAQRQEIAASFAQNTVRIPVYNAPDPVNHATLQWLSPWLYCGKDPVTKLATLRVARILPDDRLQSLSGQLVGKKHMTYRHDYGYGNAEY